MSDPAEQEEDESASEIIVIAPRTSGGSSGGPGNGAALLSIIARSGGTNHPQSGFIEALRGLFTTQTDYDLDTRFTEAQRQIILTALRGLADHPVYGPAMAALAAKGADINIIADFTGEHTGSNRGIIVGRNEEDGTIDQGESITIYINMNHGGAPITNTSFSEVIVHELLHSLGAPSIDLQIDTPGSTIVRELRNEIFSGYDFNAAPNLGAIQGDVLDVANTGGALAGSGAFEIFSGSDFADEIAPGAGGSLIYSGGGDDRITLAFGSGVDEIVDSAGLDTLILPSSASLSSISLRWSAAQHDLAVMLNGQIEAVIRNATGNGAVEHIWVDGVSYALSAFAVSTNVAPGVPTINAEVFDSFYGGFVANGGTWDANGDALRYRIGDVWGDYASEAWRVDANSGMLFADFTRYAEPGSKFTFVTLIVSDSLDESLVTVSIRWGNSGELEPPIGSAFMALLDEPPINEGVLTGDLWPSPSLEGPAFYG